ncbi:protein DpdD [Hafnia alvei]|uniref:protein DpdD n=1 Tax=Hafnia alvei TaxID=569 RepID=UPI0021F48317|nr:protein DpdD [Hafnia alvei]MCV9379194.1 protein DpdD [Hafnia alvei]
MITIPEWLEAFYADVDEKIDLNKVLEKSYKHQKFNSWLLPLIEAACQNQMPCFIPSARPDLTFYALAPDGRSLDELRRFLIAGLGSADTPSDFLIRYHPVNDSEKLLLKQCPDGFIKFSLLPALAQQVDSRDRVFGWLAGLLNLYACRPQLSSTARRQTGRILRDFYTAVHAHDGVAASAYLDEIRNNNALSPRNTLFLELLALAAGSQWGKIVAHEKIGDVLGGRIPLNIQSLLVRTLGHMGLDRLLLEGFHALPFEEARALSQRLRPLFKKTPAFSHQSGNLRDWQLWTLGAATLGYAEWENSSPLLTETWKSTLRDWIGGMHFAVNTSAEISAEQPSVLLISSEQAKRMLLDIFGGISTEQEMEIYSQLLAIPDATQQALRQNERLWAFWEELQDKYRVDKYGWMSWLQDICNTSQLDQLEQLRQRMDGQWREWLISSFDELGMIAILESGISEAQGKLLRNILPLFLTWMESNGVCGSSQLWLAWLTLLAADDIHFEQDVRLGGLLLDKCLTGQFSVSEYQDALDACEAIWSKSASLRALAYAIETAEILLDSPSVDHSLMQKYWVSLQTAALRRWDRLDNSLQMLIRILSCSYLGAEAESAFPSQLEQNAVMSSLQRDLKGKMLAIYSLTEGAARRGKDALMKLYPGLMVETNHDHVATQALVNMAQKADFFIFASGSSKHQAFYTVSDCRKDIIYPSGKGASSIVAAFIQSLG